MKYNVEMLVTGTITKVIEANSSEEAKEIVSVCTYILTY